MRKNIILSLAVLLLALPTYGALTAYNSFFRKTAPWDSTADPNFAYTEDGGDGYTSVTPPSYPSGNPDFSTALDIDASFDPFVLWYTGDSSPGAINNTLNPVEGTIEMWIRPNWYGTNQGGTGAGLGVGECQDLFVTGASELGGPLNIIFFNNGYPDDGGQLFLSWTDGVDNWNMNSSYLQPAPPPSDTNGTTYDWAEGEWHHVAASWDADTVGLYLDGGTVIEKARTNLNIDMFGNGGYLFSKNTASGVVNIFDGMVDDVAISNHAKYTSGVGGPYLPTGPIVAPDPAELRKAWNPTPASPSTVYRATNLSWNAGDYAVTHKVYWDPCEAYVVNRTVTPIVLSIGTETTPPPVTPSIDTTYYWAVDEVDSVPSTAAGNLWQYTTLPWIFVDDMESYDLSGDPDTGNQIYDIWVDGYYGTSGAAVAAQPDGFEDTAKAMEYKYSNNGTSPYGPGGYPYYSEIVADTSNLDCGSDWTSDGVAWLQLNFKGTAANDPNDRMYVVIEDSTDANAMVQYGLPDSYSNPTWAEDMNDIRSDTWDSYGWAIDLRSFTGVDLADVQKVYIGFGERGKVNDSSRSGAEPGQYQGVVIFDEIRLLKSGVYRPGDIVPLSADLYDDGTVDFKDLAVLASEYLLIEDDGMWPIY